MNNFEDQLKGRWKTFKEVFDPRQESWFEFSEEKNREQQNVDGNFTSGPPKRNNEEDGQRDHETTKRRDDNERQEGQLQLEENGGKNTGFQPQEGQEELQSPSHNDTMSTLPLSSPSPSSSWNYHDHFAPISTSILVFKFCNFLFSFLVFFNGFRLIPGPFFLAYFTYWGVFVTSLYSGASFLCSINRWRYQRRPPNETVKDADVASVAVGGHTAGTNTTRSKTITILTQDQRNGAEESSDTILPYSSPSSLSSPSSPCISAADVLPMQYKVSWILLTIALHTSFLIMVVYWPWILSNWQWEDQQQHKKKWYNIAAHGGLFILSMIDGFLINKIPMKWLHWLWAAVPFEIIYIFWTLIYSLWTPGIRYPEQDDDAIYPGILEYQNYPVWRSIATVIFLLFMMGPFLFSILRWISLYCFRSSDRSSRVRKEEQPTKQNEKRLFHSSTTITTIPETSAVVDA